MTLVQARALDAADPLRGFRARFALPADVIYLDGNSLGALPRTTPGRVAALVEKEWARDLITSWNRHGWIDAPVVLGDRIAPLIGAEPGEVLVADSTSVNLFKLLGAALAARPGRATILSEPGNFPTDLYVASGLTGLTGTHRLRTVAADAIMSAIDEDVAVVMLTHVHYKSGRRHDLAAITAAAHARGALVLWDLSHSVGAVAVDLTGCEADLAVGCGYKYLSGGPGAPAFLYVAARHQATFASPMAGWMGHHAPFAFDDDYRPASGVRRFLTGTPPVIALAALDEGVALVAEAGMRAIEAKARALTAFFVEAVEALCPGLALASPRDPAARGGHVCFAHEAAYRVMQALIARRVIGDFRAPDLLRFGFAPLYVRFEDAWLAAEVLADVLATQAWRDFADAPAGAVT